MMPTLHPELIAALRDDLAEASYTVASVTDLLGPVAAAALSRDQALPAERITRASANPVAVLVRLFALGDPVEQALVASALPRLGSAGAIRLGLARAEGDALVAIVDLRPYTDGELMWWIASDLGELATRAPLPEDHVLGVGGASTTLASWTPRPDVIRALDLGTGCGVQALHLGAHAREIVVTDISQRALAFVRFNAALNGQNWDIRHGSMLDPVAGEQFSLIVSNPPFVITPRGHGLPTFEYRDAGERGDAVVEHLVTHVGQHLEPGGMAQLLGNWEIVDGAPWTHRVGAWAREAGVDVWVIQREVQDPAQYAETWARDGGHLSGTGEFARMYAAWLDDFASREVTGIGFGVITLHRPSTDRAPFVELLDARAPVRLPMGATILAGMRARAWLAEHSDEEVLDETWVVAPDITLAQHFRPGRADPEAIELRQGGGLQRRESLDTGAASYLSVADGDLTPRQALAAIAGLLESDQGELVAAMVPRLRSWIADGILLPEGNSAEVPEGTSADVPEANSADAPEGNSAEAAFRTT